MESCVSCAAGAANGVGGVRSGRGDAESWICCWPAIVGFSGGGSGAGFPTPGHQVILHSVGCEPPDRT